VHEWFIAYPNYASIGDSITAGHNFFDPDPSYYGDDDDYQNTWQYYANIGAGLRNNLIVNYGVGGETSEEVNARVNAMIKNTQARTVFLSACNNDYGEPITLAARSTNIQDSVNKLKRWNDTQVVLINAVYPNSDSGGYPDNADYYREWWNDYSGDIERTSSKLDIMTGSGILDGNYMDTTYVESDGVHPNASGYELIGNYIESQE
jgi:lysophospholipase L1-like esterase